MMLGFVSSLEREVHLPSSFDRDCQQWHHDRALRILRAALPQSVSGLTSLQNLSLNECTELKSIPDVSQLKELTALNVVGCGNLDELPIGLNTLKGCCVTFDDGEVVVGS